MNEMKERVAITVKRGVQNEEPHFEVYHVPYREGMSVLDAIMWVRTNIDSSLAVRYSCINANACKECMVMVDGKTQYACTTRLLNRDTTIEPLSNKVLIKDLVTDIMPPKENLHFIVKNTPSNV